MIIPKIDFIKYKINNKFYEVFGFDKIHICVSVSLNKFVEKKILHNLSVFRSFMVDNFGYCVPHIRITSNEKLEENTVRIFINGNKIHDFKITPNEEGANILLSHLMYVCIQYADEILRNDDAEKYIKLLKKNNKNEYIYLIKYISHVRKVLVNLLVEGISIKNIEKISELICYYSFEKYTPDEMSELIRTDRMIQHYIKEQCTENNEIIAYELSDEMTNAIKNADCHSKEYQIITMIKQYSYQKKIETIICNKQIRLKFFRIIRDICPETTVIAYEELLKTISIKNEGIINLNNSPNS